MRLIAPGGRTPPREVNKYLLLHEHQVITVRMHPAVLLSPVVIAVAGLVAAVVLQGTILKNGGALVWVVWILWGILLVRAVWRAATWAVDYFVVTSQRMILTSGLLTRKVAMMPLNKVTDMSFQRSFAGRLFGYGEFIIESAGQDQALRNIPYLPYPEQLYLEVCNLLFPTLQQAPDPTAELLAKANELLDKSNGLIAESNDLIEQNNGLMGKLTELMNNLKWFMTNRNR